MKIKLALGAVAFALIASTVSAQSTTECEAGIMLVGDILADPVIQETRTPSFWSKRPTIWRRPWWNATARKPAGLPPWHCSPMPRQRWATRFPDRCV